MSPGFALKTARTNFEIGSIEAFPKLQFRENNLKFREKNGYFAVFSKAFPETNRVLGKALYTM
jgi:hypothetical protein